MKIKLWRKICLALLLSVALLSLFVYSAEADEAKYIYDDLGRLYQVIDSAGNMATYNYDAIGNLVSITRGTGGLNAPFATTISPDSAAAGDTVAVTISGNNLAGATVTTTNPDIYITDVNTNQNSITATFSLSSVATPGLAAVMLTNSLGSTQVGFTVNPPNPSRPTITSVTPDLGPVTRIVEIEGTGFESTPDKNIVSFNGVSAPVYSSTSSRLLASVPAGATTGPLTVMTTNGTSNAIIFYVSSTTSPAPTIISVFPNMASVGGGSTIIVSGSGFTPDSVVYIGGKHVSKVTIVDSSTIEAITASSSPGTYDVLVSNVNGDAFLPGGFIYSQGSPEKITAVNPAAGTVNIPINTPVSVLFSRSVNRASVTASSLSLVETGSAQPVPGTFSFDFGDSAVMFKPNAYLKPNTSYSISITSDIRSVEGIPPDQPFSGSFITGNSVDTITPAVEVSPGNGANGVPLNSLIGFVFSEPVNPITINSYTITVTSNGLSVPGVIAVGQQNTVATFTPLSSFAPASQVSVALSHKITDAAGNSLMGSSGPGTDITTTFATGTTHDMVAPQVISIDPADRSTGVAADTAVTVTFSEPINPLSVSVNAFMISPASQSHLFFSNGNTTLTFIPIEPLPLNSLITVTLGAGISDMAGNGMPSSFASTFFTGASLDNGQPSVVTVSPYQTYYNQTDVPLNSDITILFDRRIDPESVDHSSFYVQWSDRYNNIGITDIDGALSVAPDGLTAALVPSQRLLPNVTYCVSYTAAIKDIAGNPLYNPGNSCFTTGSVPNDVTAPRVIAVSPVNGAKNVPLNAEVMIQFSEAIDETTIRNNNVIVSKAGIQVEGWLTTEQDSTVVRYRAANSMNFDPSTFYQLTVTTGVKDTAGNTLPQPFTSGFTTGAAADAQKLHVASIVPADNATNVSPDSTIEITFTKQIDPVTINENTVWWYPGVRGSHTLSADGKTLTFTPSYPLFAGTYYTLFLDVEDVVGNMPWEGSFHFTTVFSPGTDPSSLPTAATVAANPKGLFADGLSTATVQITNISRNGVLVPDGTKIAVTSQPDFQTDTTGDAIIGGVTSPTDARYQIVTTVGGAAIVTYQSPNLPDLAPGAASYGYIQVRSVDAGNRIAGAVGSGQVVLFRAKSAQIDVSQPALFADGSTSSQVRITVIAGARPMAGLALMTDPSTSLTFVQSPMDPLDQPVPPGTKIGVTVQPVYRNDSLGGTITGGTPAPDSRFTVFTTTGGGTIDLTYTSPALPITQSGDAWIQVVEVDDEGNNVGLIGLMNISLYGF